MLLSFAGSSWGGDRDTKYRFPTVVAVRVPGCFTAYRPCPVPGLSFLQGVMERGQKGAG